MLKKKPIIFATGCSFTDPDYFSGYKFLPDEKRGGWPVWPELIKNKIEKETGISYELINMAKSGGSNDWVYNTCLDVLAEHDKRVKIILIGGTDWMRSQIVPPQKNFNPQADPLYYRDEDDNHLKHIDWQFLKPYHQASVEMWARWSNCFGIQQQIYHNLRHMWTLKQICNDKNIKFIWNQLLNPITGYSYWKEQIVKYGYPEEKLNIQKRAFERQFFDDTILKSPYGKLLVKNKKYFYGFAWSQGGYWEDEIWNRGLLGQEEMILPPTIIDGKEECDGHPSATGHKQIALDMWKRYGNYLVKN